MLKKRVAVLRGGPSSEYDVSLKTGAGVLEALGELGLHTIDIIVTRQGEWLVHGVVRSPEQALSTADVVFIAMHGAYGEDGTVQKICERLHIPFTGSNAFPSSIAFNKDATKKHLRESGIKMPKHVRVDPDIFDTYEMFTTALTRAVGKRFVIKPLTSGSSHGVRMVQSVDDLHDVLKDVFNEYDACLIEERIDGVEATCGILEGFRDEKHYILPPIEIVPPTTHDFFSADVKYDGSTAEICPGRFSFAVREALGNAALTAHVGLGLSQYSRSDFMIKGDDVYFLEVNTLPGLTSESLFPKAAAAVGLTFSQLIEHLIVTARVR
ncbi:MAG: D-alanine--D-alanine ligase [Candidatus Paceibacteria bacterium]